MDVMAVKTAQISLNNSYAGNPQITKPEELALDKPVSANNPETRKSSAQSEGQAEKELTHDEVDQLTEHLNKFMTEINSDMQFELHDETRRMMVRFIDRKDGHVIKEFPPRELLDTLAAIRDYVGVLLDKKV